MLSAACLSPACPHLPTATWRGYLLRPLLMLALLALVWNAAGGDLWLADWLYKAQGHAWALRHAWWLQDVLHHGGQKLSQWAGIALVLTFAITCCHARCKRWRTPLLYLLLALALSSGVVALLKQLTQMDCPWSLQRYGGLRPFVGLFESRPSTLGRAVCFPAGHASAGYAWLALYFFALRTRPHWRWWGVAVGLVVGAVFGFAQQLRGAHFLSHDLATLAICWGVAAGLFMCMFRREEH